MKLRMEGHTSTVTILGNLKLVYCEHWFCILDTHVEHPQDVKQAQPVHLINHDLFDDVFVVPSLALSTS